MQRPVPGPRLPSCALDNILEQLGMYTGREAAPSCCTLDASTMRDLFSKEVKQHRGPQSPQLSRANSCSWTVQIVPLGSCDSGMTRPAENTQKDYRLPHKPAHFTVAQTASDLFQVQELQCCKYLTSLDRHELHSRLPKVLAHRVL